MVTCVCPGPAFPGTAYFAFDAGSSRLGSVSLVDRESVVESRRVGTVISRRGWTCYAITQ